MADDTSSTLSVTAAGTTTQLRGPWLWAARVLWGIAVVITLIALVVATPLRLDYLRQVSPQANSTQGQLLPEDAQALEQLGLSPGIYSAYFTVLELIVAGAALLVAGLLFWRRSDDRAVVAISFAFVASVFASSPLISTTTVGLPVWGADSSGYLVRFRLILLGHKSIVCGAAPDRAPHQSPPRQLHRRSHAG